MSDNQVAQSATYSKLKNGEWGIRVTGPCKEGDSIRTTKRDGTTKDEHVKAVLWAGNGITLCTIYQQTAAPRSNGNGYARGKRCFCAECGEPYRKGQQCWENGGNCVPSWE